MDAANPTGGQVYDAVQNPSPTAIVVYCGDPRFQVAFDQFIENGLKLAKGQFIPLVIGGGAGVLSQPEKLPKEFKFLKDRFDLIRAQFPSVKRVILINHEDCEYYGMLREKFAGFLNAHGFANHPREDMQRIAGIARLLLPFLGVSLDMYYARFADEQHTKIAFEPIKAG